MRKRFEQQLTLGVVPISEVIIWEKSRHQLPALLIGLKYIFMTPSLNEEIFVLLEQKIIGDKNSTGRPGMSLWEILVFGVVRLNLDLDYDHLHDMSNYHRGLRGILGVDGTNAFEDQHYYHLQTLKDNVGLLDEELLKQINEMVVKAGHSLLKKKRRNRTF